MSKKVTQADRVLQYIKENGSITALEAVRELGVLQLSARLIDLERSGVRFCKKQEASLNRYGDKVYYTRYSLAD